MLILRCTGKVLKKLKVNVSPESDSSDTVLGDWFVNLFMLGRNGYFLFTNASSLLSVVTHADDELPMPEFISRLNQLFCEYGIPKTKIHSEYSRMNKISIGKTNNRSVIGSMTDFVAMLSRRHERRGPDFDPTSPEMHHEIWECPMGALSYQYPIHAAANILDNREIAQDRPEIPRLRDQDFNHRFSNIEPLEPVTPEHPQTAYSPPALTLIPSGGILKPTKPPATKQAKPKSTLGKIRKEIIRASASGEPIRLTLFRIVQMANDPGQELAHDKDNEILRTRPMQ